MIRWVERAIPAPWLDADERRTERVLQMQWPVYGEIGGMRIIDHFEWVDVPVESDEPD